MLLISTKSETKLMYNLLREKNTIELFFSQRHLSKYTCNRHLKLTCLIGELNATRARWTEDIDHISGGGLVWLVSWVAGIELVVISE